MESRYRNYWSHKKILQAEEDTIQNLDIVNDTNYLSLFKKGEITAKEIASKNHEDGLLYEVTILEDNKPIVFLEINHQNEFIDVNFIDEEGRNYLNYHFIEVEPKKKLFLREVWYYYFSNAETNNDDSRVHFVFDPEGNVAYREYDNINEKGSDYEINEFSDVESLYEPYPEFGNYEGLTKLERQMTFLDNIDGIKL